MMVIIKEVRATQSSSRVVVMVAKDIPVSRVQNRRLETIVFAEQG